MQFFLTLFWKIITNFFFYLLIFSKLPPLDIILHLVELYFRHVHGQTYSFLHKPSLIPRICKGQVNKALVLALCGLTARYSRHPAIANRVPYLAGEGFINDARRIISIEFDEPNLETIQAMIIIIQHDFFRSKGKKSMIYISMAIRMAATLELHEESPDPKLTFLEREQRRRTYWSLVVLDRLAHSGPHWHVQLRTDIIAIQLPCTDYCYEHSIPVITEKLNGDPPATIKLGRNSVYPTYPKGKLGLYAYIVKITILWCDINKYVMEGHKKEKIPPWKEGSIFHELETRLQTLFSELPKEYQYSRERLIALDTVNQGGALVHLHGELLMSLCYLNRVMYPYNYKKMKFDEPPPASFIERAAINIMASAKAQSSMIEDVLMMEDFNIAPFIGFGVFAVSSVHIANSFSKDPSVASAAKNNLAINLKFLVIMREYWYSVGVWCIILKDRYFQKAQRHKIKLQQEQYTKEGHPSSRIPSKSKSSKKSALAKSKRKLDGENADDSGAAKDEDGASKDEDESMNDVESSDEEGSKLISDGFSRPGTPPLPYAPDGLMNVAANRSQQSGSSSGVSSPGLVSSTAPSVSSSGNLNTGDMRFSTNTPDGLSSNNRASPNSALNAASVTISDQQASSDLSQASFARTWAKAVPQVYGQIKNDSGNNSHSNNTTTNVNNNNNNNSNNNNSSMNYDDANHVAKKVRYDSMFNDGSNINSYKQESNNGLELYNTDYTQPASPSQFADIITMSALSHVNRNLNSNTNANADINKQKANPNNNNNNHAYNDNSQGTTIIGVSSTSKNNLLTDTSGEWLNSLDPSDDFQQYADEKSLAEINSMMWFNNGMIGNNNSYMSQQQQQRIQQLLIEKYKTQYMNMNSNSNNNSSGISPKNSTESNNKSFEPQQGSKHVRVLIDQEQPTDLSIVDESLFQNSMIHQPFTPISSHSSLASRSSNASIISRHNQNPYIKSPLDISNSSYQSINNNNSVVHRGMSAYLDSPEKSLLDRTSSMYEDEDDEKVTLDRKNSNDEDLTLPDFAADIKIESPSSTSPKLFTGSNNNTSTRSNSDSAVLAPNASVSPQLQNQSQPPPPVPSRSMSDSQQPSNSDSSGFVHPGQPQQSQQAQQQQQQQPMDLDSSPQSVTTPTTNASQLLDEIFQQVVLDKSNGVVPGVAGSGNTSGSNTVVPNSSSSTGIEVDHEEEEDDDEEGNNSPQNSL